MKASEFRKLALAMPLASEGEHMGHADFRAAGKIFASLPPGPGGVKRGKGGKEGKGEWGMVALPPREQAALVREHPGVFVPAAGAWGRRGYTYVALGEVDRRVMKRAVEMAWRNIVPERVREELGDGAGKTRKRSGGKGAGKAVRVGLKRVYEPREKSDGTRVLVERLWPRGLTKERAGVDVWMKEVSPSPALRKWYGHDPAKWEEFQRRYRKELAANAEAVEELRRLAREGPVTLVYAASDQERNSAAVLRAYLAGK